MKANVVVDEVGRLVWPKNIREAIGVYGRMSVTVEVIDKAARITTLEPTQKVVASKRGRLVYTGKLPENWDSGEAVLQQRQRRLRR